MKISITPEDRETLDFVARTSLRTKLQESLADQLTGIVTEAVLAIRKEDEPIDLHMVSAVNVLEHLSNCEIYNPYRKQEYFVWT